ncbi:MAG: GLUG motif-containing protein [Acutalibacteraceae bacterium]
MKTHIKKGLATILCFAMLVGLIPGVGTVTVSAADDDGTVPQQNTDGYYEISNADQLYWFASLVNGTLTDGTGRNPSANAVLTADIIVNENVLNDDGDLNTELTNPKDWMPIGDTSVHYTGKFDGQKHTVSGLYFKDTATTYPVGLFGCIGTSGCVSNVGVVDSYFIGNDNVGGVCGWNLGGTIENCYNSGEVISTTFMASVGGVCGYNSGTITNCYNSGKVSATGVASRVGGVCGANYDGGKITNCYYDSDVYTGDAVGGNSATVGENVLGKTTDEFSSGEVAYLLQSGQTEVDGNIPQVWGQAVGTDDYPLLNGLRVYQNVTYKGCENAPGEASDYSYSNEDKFAYSEHTFDESSNGFCIYCGKIYEPATLTTDKYDIDGDGTNDSVYEIGNAGQLYWFAQQVNSGSTSLNAILTADITVNENVLNDDGDLNTELTNPREWTPIGNNSTGYKGVFDGKSHTVSGLYFNDTTAMYVGLFGCVNGTVANVEVVDSYFKGLNFVGGVCGLNNAGEILNCYNSGNIAVTAVETGCVGGVCGWNKGIMYYCFNSGKVSASGNNANKASAGGVCGWNYYSVESCYNLGDISATATVAYVGGVCGYNYYNVTISNCYNIGKVSAAATTAYVGGVCGMNESGNINDCFYLDTATSGVGYNKADTGTVVRNISSKTEAQFKSGEVAYLMSEYSDVWGQNIDNGEARQYYPVISTAKVYQVSVTYCDGTEGTGYSNTDSSLTHFHKFNDNGVCTLCGQFEDGMGALYGYNISLDGTIGLNFVMELAEDYASNKPKMDFTVKCGNDVISTQSVTPVPISISSVSDKTYYKFTCKLAAKEMTCKVTGQLVSGDKKGKEFNYTVVDYADTLLNGNDYDEATKNLVISMLNYGAASQKYFGFNTANFANRRLTDEQKVLPDTQASNLSAYKSSYTKDESYTGSTSYYGSSLVLESGTDVKHYFKYDSANTSVDRFACKDGIGNYYQIAQSGDYLHVRIDNIPAHKLGDTVTLTLSESNGDNIEKLGDISYSPLSYAYSVLNAYPTDDGTHDNIRNLVKSLYQYYLKADEYANPQQVA